MDVGISETPALETKFMQGELENVQNVTITLLFSLYSIGSIVQNAN